ncbi:MAG: PucR family transcriptional regulator [Pseudoclavibacter sp.]
MHATITSLLEQSNLGLRLISGSGAAMRRQIEWATATEVLDPRPFLTGEQLVLTTGLRARSVKAQRAFIASIVEAGSVGLAFGTGFTHDAVPSAIVAAARAADLPVVEVPYATSFEAVTRYVSDARASERFAHLETRQRQQQQLFASMMSDDGQHGLEGLTTQLAKFMGAHVAVSRHGEVLAGSLDVDDDSVEGWDVLPIAATLTTQATLHVSQPRRNDDLLTVARSLVGLSLSQQARRIHHSRTIAGQVVDDLTQGRLESEEAAIRLGSIGHPEGGRTRVLAVEGVGARAREVLDLPLPPRLDHVVGAIVDGRLIVLLPARESPRESAEVILAVARSAGLAVRVGIGDAYPGARNLRWSYFEALDSIAGLADGVDIGERSRLSMSALILASRDAPVHELAEEVLSPLDTSDRGTGTALVATLDAYLRHSGAVGDVATELGTHRNTVRYRVEQITSLTGYDPRVTADAVQLWLALAARRIGA